VFSLLLLPNPHISYLRMTKEQRVVDAHQGKQASTRFVYPPLIGDNDFRLLRVMPARKGQLSIHCKLFPASFTTQAQKYIAGSYVWGPPHPTTPILVNGCAVHVRTNLFHFLRACRTRYSYRTLWIDALCISKKHHVTFLARMLTVSSSQTRMMSQKGTVKFAE
jgi:hypothetical protein